jgi:molybdate transport system substrate-binding protein
MPVRLLLLPLALAALATPRSAAADVTVLSGGAVKTAFLAASQAWETQSGVHVSVTFAPAGELRSKLASGEVADVIVLPVENFAALEQAGAVVPGSRHALGAVGMGAAVRAGAPMPDISSPEALKHTLLTAKSVTYMDPTRGTSGKYFDEVLLPKLGIRDAVRAKATLGKGGSIAEMVARGEVEIAFHQMTEMLPVEGITIVGPLPAALQKTTVYAAAVMSAAKHAAQARALIDYLASTAGRKAFLDRGFTAP